MNIEHWPLDRIIHYARNPRKNDAAIASVKASIKEFGFRQPIVVDRDGVIVAGHTRYMAAQQLELKTVPVHVAAELTPIQIKAYRLADNRTAQNATWDDELLGLELEELKADDFDLDLTGFTEDELAKLISAEQVETNVDAEPQIDKAEELRIKWDVDPGQLWALGEHRLICGDCTDESVVARVMDGARAILFATDPPYLVDYDGKNHPSKSNKDWSASYGNVNWDASGSNESFKLYDDFIRVARKIAILDNAAWYCWHASRHQAKLEEIWIKNGAFVHQQIIWYKTNPVLTRSWYMWQHEPCLFGWVKPNKPPRIGTSYPKTVWDIKTESVSKHNLHPTVKPVGVFEIPIKQHTHPGDICYEPFSGGGTQIIACERLGRRCMAIEISPVYVAVALQRFLDATGVTPEKIS